MRNIAALSGYFFCALTSTTAAAVLYEQIELPHETPNTPISFALKIKAFNWAENWEWAHNNRFSPGTPKALVFWPYLNAFHQLLSRVSSLYGNYTAEGWMLTLKGRQHRWEILPQGGCRDSG